MKEKITIIIPTHYRHNYLERLLRYYENSGFKILVADSTDIVFEQRNEFDISYFHYPDASYFYKMNDIVQKVQTPYVVLCADDDFVVKESLLECVNFLENNQDYSCVQGRYIGFLKHDNKAEFRALYFNKKDFKVTYNNVFPRLSEYMHNYMQLFYAVHRTDQVRSFFVDSYAHHMHNPILLEIGLGIYAMVSGKYKTLESLYSARDIESVSSDVDRTTLDLIVEDAKYKEVLGSFLNMTSRFIDHKDPYVNGMEILHASIALYNDRLISTKRGAAKRKKQYEKKLEEDGAQKDIGEIMVQHKLLKIKRGYNQVRKHKGYPLDDKTALKSWDEIKALVE